MARIKISELNAKTTVEDTDLLPIVDTINDETKKITKGDLINDIYSTSEVKTNKRWIDGKPIYRKTITTNLPNAQSVGVEHGIVYLDKVTNIDGIGHYPNYISCYPIPKISAGSGDYFVSITMDTHYITFMTNQNLSNHIAIVTIEYTKTTD